MTVKIFADNETRTDNKERATNSRHSATSLAHLWPTLRSPSNKQHWTNEERFNWMVTNRLARSDSTGPLQQHTNGSNFTKFVHRCMNCTTTMTWLYYVRLESKVSLKLWNSLKIELKWLTFGAKNNQPTRSIAHQYHVFSGPKNDNWWK